MKGKERPHEMFKEKYNGLSSTQEVLYTSEFKRADKAAYRQEQQKKENDSLKM